MIEVRDVTLQHPGARRPALEDVSFRLEAGENVALLGANGSGKTTLARLLNGTQLPTRGRVLVDGHDTRDPEARFHVRRLVGLLFQDPDNQFVTTTLEREIAFGLENLNIDVVDIQRAVHGAIAEFELNAHRHTAPHEMSGGEKARLALACVWVMGPRAVVLDETDSLLDRRGGEMLVRKLGELPARTTVLRVTTDVEVAASCARVLVLHEGRLVADGPPDAVFTKIQPEAAQRVGAPLVWRVSELLVRLGRLRRPTVSLEAVLTSLGLTGVDPGGAA